MSLAVEPRLSPAEVTQFRKEGYLLHDRPVFPRAEFDALKKTFENLLAAFPSDRRPEQMDTPHFDHPELFRWLLSDSVLDIVEPILGPDIALFSSHFICKPGRGGHRVPWHEDSAYWAGRLDPMDVVTVWLAIDPSTPENGCMSVIPGSHVNGYSTYRDVDDKEGSVFPTQIVEEEVDTARAVPMILQPNQCSLHESKMIHGSAPNESGQRRCGYTMRFISTRTKFATQHHPGFQIYLARGRDHAGNEYGDPTLPNSAFRARMLTN